MLKKTNEDFFYKYYFLFFDDPSYKRVQKQEESNINDISTDDILPLIKQQQQVNPLAKSYNFGEQIRLKENVISVSPDIFPNKADKQKLVRVQIPQQQIVENVQVTRAKSQPRQYTQKMKEQSVQTQKIQLRDFQPANSRRTRFVTEYQRSFIVVEDFKNLRYPRQRSLHFRETRTRVLPSQ